MNFWKTLTSWRNAPGFGAPADVTTVNFSHSEESEPRPLDVLIRDMLGTGATPRASRAEALSVPAVLRGRNLLCSIATLPLQTRGPDRSIVRTPLLEQIDPNTPNLVTLSQTIEDLVFEGLAWWQITAFGFDGFPVSAMHVDATAVSLDPPPGTPIQTLPSGVQPGGVVWIDGKPVPGREMIRFDSPNPGLLKAAGRSIRRAITLEKTADLYAADPRMLDYFSPVEGADPVDDDDVKKILDGWTAARRDRATGYVPAALKHNQVDTPSPADLQLIELQNKATIDIANALGIDPEDLGVSTTTRTYANAVDRRRDRINDTLSPYMQAVTSRLSMNDVTKRGHLVAFSLDDYMRANPNERWSTHQTALDTGVKSVEEIRSEEGLVSIPVERAPQQRATQPQQSAPEQEQETADA